MKVSTFIERPVLSAVISITIMVAGIIGLFTLPVEQYPDIAPPTVMVSTTYFGANAETMQKSVVAPKRTEPCIESDRAIAGRGYPSGCHDFQAPDQYVTDLLAL